MTPLYWVSAMFAYGMLCYIVGGLEERRDHAKRCKR